MHHTGRFFKKANCEQSKLIRRFIATNHADIFISLFNFQSILIDILMKLSHKIVDTHFSKHQFLFCHQGAFVIDGLNKIIS